ncbi:MAG: hypothetical protein I3273_07080 [Candidatus Moeniiplasma glomeromycotorum]|nr:hypothetical protein [Candidatus Moeniiplasma glomeromycotorum]MCE8168493.1 hypothetical protein [Candidatus Moeniiplasma glomeromycotorum]MCE8169849.1 hypothetical protein [Candidatus Moeniiplasma glomeromycotorum]
MNNYHLFWIIPLTLLAGIIIGALFISWYLANKIRKELGFKNMKEFIKHAKKAQELQKKMEKEGIAGIMNDPKIRKQMEDLQKKFRQPK